MYYIEIVLAFPKREISNPAGFTTLAAPVHAQRNSLFPVQVEGRSQDASSLDLGPNST